MSIKIKERAAADFFQPAQEIVENVYSVDIEEDRACPSLPSITAMERRANRHRQRMRPQDPNDLNFESKLSSPMVISIVKNVETKEDFAEALDEIANTLSDMSEVMHSNGDKTESIKNPERYGHMQFIPEVTGDTIKTGQNLQDKEENPPENDDNPNYLKKLEAIFEAANIESDDSENGDDSQFKATVDDDDSVREDSVRPADDSRKSEFILDELVDSDNGNKDVNDDSIKNNQDTFTNLHQIEDLLISRTGSSRLPKKSIKHALVDVKRVGLYLEELYVVGSQFIHEPMSSARDRPADQLSGSGTKENSREFLKEVNEETIQICVKILEDVLKIVHNAKHGALD